MLKKTIRKILKIIFACLYSLLSVFWSFIFVQEAIWASSTIGMDGFHYFSRIDLLSALWLLWPTMLLVCCVLSVVAILKKRPIPALNIVLTVLNGTHFTVFYLIPPQAYYTSLYLTYRSTLHIPENLMPIVSSITNHASGACLIISMVILIIRTIRGSKHEEILSRRL